MGDSLVSYAAFIISSLTILSYLLAINEYYNNKAYWDYFHIDDRIRTNMRSGFHAEYLSYALVITCVFILLDGVLVYFNDKVADKNDFIFYYILICIEIFVVSFGSLYFVIRKFNSQDVNERRIWTDVDSFVKYIFKLWGYSLIKLGIPYVLIVIALYFYSIETEYLMSVILFAIAFIVLQFVNYSQRQALLVNMKCFNIYKPNEEQFVVLAQHGNTAQMNRCTIDNGILNIYLDDVKILTSDCLDYQTIYVDKFEKYCNGAVCTKHYAFGFREDFKRKKIFTKDTKDSKRRKIVSKGIKNSRRKKPLSKRRKKR